MLQISQCFERHRLRYSPVWREISKIRIRSSASVNLTPPSTQRQISPCLTVGQCCALVCRRDAALPPSTGSVKLAALFRCLFWCFHILFRIAHLTQCWRRCSTVKSHGSYPGEDEIPQTGCSQTVWRKGRQQTAEWQVFAVLFWGQRSYI